MIDASMNAMHAENKEVGRMSSDGILYNLARRSIDN